MIQRLFCCTLIGAWNNGHNRVFIQQIVETDTKTHSQMLG